MKKLSIVSIIVIFGLIGIILGLNYVPRISSQNGTASSVSSISVNVPEDPKESKIEVIQTAEPQSITIPKLNVNAAIEQVGEDNSGKMEVPKGVFNVGWYNLGFKPGEKGAAVMAGHLDTVTGAPAVFYSIGQLQPGDQVIVTDKNGSNLTFEVTKVQSYPFDQVPLEQVFGSSQKPMLNLITCTGTWDTGARNYSNRLVVYTELKS